MDPFVDKSFGFAQDTTKQMITLSTAVIALVITFSKDVIKNPTAGSTPFLLIALGAYLVSAVAGAITLMALTGNLGRGTAAALPSIYANDIRIPSLVQMVAFAAALALTVAYALLA